MYFSSQDIFLFVILVPLLIFIGKKMRGDFPAKKTTQNETPGIAEIRDEILGATKFNYSYVVGGVKVYVHERELQEARELLTRHREIASFEGKDWAPRICPKCASDLLTYQKFHPASSLLLLLGAPFIPLKAGRWVCLKCSHKWKEADIEIDANLSSPV